MAVETSEREPNANMSGKDKQIDSVKRELIESVSSINIMNDKWTLSDELNVGIYTKALSRFLSEQLRKIPLSISIQAPWGGGKTSLMRMIQHHLDNHDHVSIGIVSSESSMRLKDFLRFFSHRDKKKEVIIPKINNLNDIAPRMTVWFNPWKYENGQQPWAGLVDCVVRSIIGRMDIGERELLLLKLNLGTNDLKRIRDWMTETKTFGFIRRIRPWLITAGITVGVFVGYYYFLLTEMPELQGALTQELQGPLLLTKLLLFLPLIIGLLFVCFKVLRTSSVMNNEPVGVTLDKVNIPDGKKLELDDLRLVLSAVPDSYQSIIVFVDDLDRCSPNVVSDVIEGINLFFTEDLPFIFLIAMDAEVVAAALEVAQNTIISKLPKYSSHRSIGWKFMDKFVQLPIVLPPFGEAAIKNYVRKMLETTNGKTPTNNTKGEDTQQGTILVNDTLQKYTQDQIVNAAYEFSNNPRDLKRFLNLLSFYRFLLGQLKKNHDDEFYPSMDKLKRWIILSLRWPILVRWLYWSPGGTLLYELKSTCESDPVRARLKLLEKITGESTQLRDWETEIKKLMRIKVSSEEDISSLLDENLKLFFESENKLDKNERLSSSAGRGIY